MTRNLMLVLALGAATFGCNGKDDDDEVKELDCSDAQREQLEALLRERHEAHRAAREGKREQHHAARAEHDAALAAAFRADDLDLSALEQLRGEHDRSERLESMAPPSAKDPQTQG